MLAHPLGELRRAHQAGLHRDVGEVRGGGDLLMAICRRRETAEHGDDRDRERKPPSLRTALAPPTVCLIGALSCSPDGISRREDAVIYRSCSSN